MSCMHISRGPPLELSIIRVTQQSFIMDWQTIKLHISAFGSTPKYVLPACNHVVHHLFEKLCCGVQKRLRPHCCDTQREYQYQAQHCIPSTTLSNRVLRFYDSNAPLERTAWLADTCQLELNRRGLRPDRMRGNAAVCGAVALVNRNRLSHMGPMCLTGHVLLMKSSHESLRNSDGQL